MELIIYSKLQRSNCSSFGKLSCSNTKIILKRRNIDTPHLCYTVERSLYWISVYANLSVCKNVNSNSDVNSSRPGDISKLTIIGADNGLSPGRCQAIIWTNTGKLLLGPLGTDFSEILIDIHTFSFRKMHLKMSSGKWRQLRFGLNVLIN